MSDFSSVDLHDPDVVRQLFDEMAETCDRVNLITSFGFSRRWRRQLVDRAGLTPESVICDIMGGIGETWFAIDEATGLGAKLIGIDFSAGMLSRAESVASRLEIDVDILQADVLESGIPDASVDHVICGFGMKTLSQVQQRSLAAELFRILRPGGTFAIVEVSTPQRSWIRIPFLAYLNRAIPWFGRLLLGNPDNYRMLGVYTEAFGDCRPVAQIMREAGLEAQFDEYFAGCATGVSGRRPLP